MKKIFIACLAVFLLSADASACGGSLGRLRSRVVHRERVIQRGHGLLGFGVLAIPAAAAPCAACQAPVVVPKGPATPLVPMKK